MPSVYAYDDPFGQGKELFGAVKAAAGEAHLFSHPDGVPNQLGTHSFLMMPTYPRAERDKTKDFHEALRKRSSIQIPSYLDGVLHDDKRLQTLQFQRWLPKTWFAEDHIKALTLIDAIEYPCLSKSATGSGGVNSFLIQDKPGAFAEIQQIFSEAGKITYNLVPQKDYVIFQQIIRQTNDFSWRITILGNRYAIISRRYKDPEKKIVLDNSRYEMIDIMENHLHDLLQYVAMFVDEYRLHFVTIDLMCGIVCGIVSKENHRPYIVSTAANFNYEWFKTGGLIFERQPDNNWVSTGRPAMRVFDLLAELILRGKFDYA